MIFYIKPVVTTGWWASSRTCIGNRNRAKDKRRKRKGMGAG